MKIFIGLEHWSEDYESHGTNVVSVSTDLEAVLKYHPDEVEIWENSVKIKSVFYNPTKGVFYSDSGKYHEITPKELTQ